MVRRSNRFTSREALALSGKDLKSYSRSEMARIVSTVASAANKRITRLEKAGQPITDTVDRFSVAGKSRNELMKEFRRVKDFMIAERLSLSGQRTLSERIAQGLAGSITGEGSGKKFKKEYQRIRDLLGDYAEPGGNVSKAETFWGSYERLAETNPFIRQKQYKYRVLGQQVKYMSANPNITKDQLHQKMQADMAKIYEEVQKETENPGDVFTF